MNSFALVSRKLSLYSENFAPVPESSVPRRSLFNQRLSATYPRVSIISNGPTGAKVNGKISRFRIGGLNLGPGRTGPDRAGGQFSSGPETLCKLTAMRHIETRLHLIGGKCPDRNEGTDKNDGSEEGRGGTTAERIGLLCSWQNDQPFTLELITIIYKCSW